MQLIEVVERKRNGKMTLAVFEALKNQKDSQRRLKALYLTQFAAVNDRMKRIVFESFKTYAKREYELKEKAKQISSNLSRNTL